MKDPSKNNLAFLNLLRGVYGREPITGTVARSDPKYTNRGSRSPHLQHDYVPQSLVSATKYLSVTNLKDAS